jgi:hypothetical protein
MRNIATKSETSNVTSLPTAPKPQTSKEVICRSQLMSRLRSRVFNSIALSVAVNLHLIGRFRS